MFPHYMQLPIAAATLLSLASGTPVRSETRLLRRQNYANSTCLSFGIDFVSGGSYFINSLSNASFTTVSQFEGCNDDLANVLLVNDATSDEYECTTLPTVPENVSQMATCPISKDQMESGDWSILVIGNNGNGNPFAYERDFYLTVAPQETITVTPTATYYQTITPTTSATSTSVIDYTTTINNTLTITQPAETDYITVTPTEVTSTSTETYTRTVKRWTKTQVIVTETVMPLCTVPPRPYNPDPWCRFAPTAIPLPPGLHIRKGRDNVPLSPAEIEARGLAKREADQPTLTSTATYAVNTTSTIFAPTSTNVVVEYSTDMVTSTLPPLTIKTGTIYDTVTAPTPTDTVYTAIYTRVTSTKTLAVTWTLTETATPTALVSSCQQQGGHFGNGWGWF